MTNFSLSAAIPRRTVLGAALLAATSCTRKSTTSFRYFTDEEARTVEAITAVLIPADTDPGAKEAGVVDYIDIQLSTHFKKHRKTYREGLATVDATSRTTYNKPFVDLTSPQQIEILNTTQEHSKLFFNLILSHTRQGFYGDPRHGGNRNRTSWKMLKLATPQVRGRQHYASEQAG